QDGVSVRLRHFSAVSARQFGGRSQERLWLGKNVHPFAGVKHVEAARNLASQFNVGNLIFAHGNEVAFVNQDIRRLQNRIAEKSVSAQVFFRNVFTLLFVSGNALQPTQGRDHRKQ